MRLSRRPNAESAFSVFYQFLAGVSSAVRYAMITTVMENDTNLNNLLSLQTFSSPRTSSGHCFLVTVSHAVYMVHSGAIWGMKLLCLLLVFSGKVSNVATLSSSRKFRAQVVVRSVIGVVVSPQLRIY